MKTQHTNTSAAREAGQHSTQVILRNKLTGLFYVNGQHFTGTQDEATKFDSRDAGIATVRYTYGGDDGMEVVPVTREVNAIKAEFFVREPAPSLARLTRHAGEYYFSWYSSGLKFRRAETAQRYADLFGGEVVRLA